MITAETLARCFPFLRKDVTLAGEILSQGQFRTLPPATTVYLEGDTCAHIAFVLSGGIRVFKANEAGREVTLYEIGPGDTCILNASCILSRTGYPANATTLERTEVLLLPAPIFRQLLAWSEDLQGFVFTLFSARLTTIMSLVEEILFNRLDHRLFDYLVEKSDNGMLVKTHQAIANDLGTSREVVSRLLKDFETKGSVRLSRSQIEILDYQPVHLGR